MNRRGFLKFAAGGTVGLVASPIIWNTLYDAVYWTQNWGWIPRLKKGANEYLPTISKLCPSGTGIRVRLVGGRPVRALGNPDNPMSQGALTALAAAETQLQVSPARLKSPLKRSPDGAYVFRGKKPKRCSRPKLSKPKGPRPVFRATPPAASTRCSPA